MKCRICQVDGFRNPHEISAHRLEAHPAIVRRERRLKNATPPPEPDVPEVESETQLVVDACAVFDAANLDADANARVVAYLSSRYGAAAVA